MGKEKFFEDEDNIESYSAEELPSEYYGTGGLASYDPSYKSMDIDEDWNKIEKQSKELISDVVGIYFQDSEEEKPAHIAAMETVESMNLETMLSNIRYAQHMLKSMLRRMNEIGAGDTQTIRTIMDLQNHALSLTITVSNYVRNLPSYFKGLKFETLPALPDGDIPGMITPGNDEFDEEYSINSPQVGTKQMLKAIEEAQKESAKTFADIEKEDTHNYNPSAKIEIIKDNIEDILKENSTGDEDENEIEPPSQSM